MKRFGEWHYRLALVVMAMVVFVPLLQWVHAQKRNTPVHLTTDWSNHHLIFSQPRTMAQAWRVANDPRYGHQWLRRNPGALLPKPQALQGESLAYTNENTRLIGSPEIRNSGLEEILKNRGGHGPGGPRGPLEPKKTLNPLRSDWGMSLLAGGTNGVEMFPAKFDFDITTTPDCVMDYVVYNTSLAGSPAQASIIAFNQLYSTQGGAGGYCGSSGPSVYWAYNTGSGTVVTSPVISGDGTKVAYVESVGSGTTGSILHILQFKAGEGTGIDTPNAAPTTLSGAWSTCASGTSCIANITFSGDISNTDSNSSPYYNYNTDTLYVGDDVGKLHKFTGVFLGTPAEDTSSPWPIVVNPGAQLSSPVMDNGSLNIFVGDNTGALSYVMEAGSTTGTCEAGSGPGGGNTTPCLGLTLGATSGNVTTVNVSTPASACPAPPAACTANGASPSGAITDAPLVDGTAGVVFVANGTEAGSNNGTMIETNTALGSGTAGQIIANIGIGGNLAGGFGVPIHSGAFDNAYLTSSDGSGNLYVCGKDPNRNSRPAIYKLSVNAGVVSTDLTGAIMIGLTFTSPVDCSPVTEIENPNAAGGAKEWIFFSFGNLANNDSFATPNVIPAGSPCSADLAGCLVSIDITSGVWPPSTVTNTVSLPANPGGASTSGIIVDNVADSASFAQAASIYFSLTVNSASGTGNPGLPQCNGVDGVGCAVKLTQAALQ